MTSFRANGPLGLNNPVVGPPMLEEVDTRARAGAQSSTVDGLDRSTAVSSDRKHWETRARELEAKTLRDTVAVLGGGATFLGGLVIMATGALGPGLAAVIIGASAAFLGLESNKGH